MILIGLTGGIGMGKSTVARFLAERGEPIIDTDELARELVQPGQPALDEIRSEFGAAVVQSDGTLDRAALARIVFADADRRTRLEAILHPRIRAAWKGRAQAWAGEDVKHGVIVIPLLFETAAEKELDLTICVACSRPAQAKRLQARGWSEVEIANRIAAQKPIEEKMDRADRVIWNEASVEVCEMQVARVFDTL
jgi:dephospho-CoA kinase